MDRVGENLQELKLELQKLSLQPGGMNRIGEKNVLALTEDTRNETPFELPLAVGRLHLKETMRLLKKNLQQGDPPLLLFSLIVRQLRLIRRAHELRANGFSKKEVEAKLKILHWRAEDFWGQVEKFPVSLLKQLWPLILETDQELKSNRSDKGLLLEKILWNLHLLARGEPN